MPPPPPRVFKRDSFWLTRIVFLRALGGIYAVAFTVALLQNRALIGENGLQPFTSYLRRVETHVESVAAQEHRSASSVDKLFACPTLFWFIDRTDENLDAVATAGLGLSITLLLGYGSNAVVMLALWVLYHTIVSVGQTFYGFGWESQLLETGFIGIFLCPVLGFSLTSRKFPPPRSILYLLLWLQFRIMLGAGLIKLRSSDTCWTELTCLAYHYETQPVPNPVSWFLHHQPMLLHQAGVIGNHIVELLAPWLLLVPVRNLQLTGGLIQVAFQVILITSGNLSFLNWLTILPAIAALDDEFLATCLPTSAIKGIRLRLERHQIEEATLAKSPSPTLRSLAEEYASFVRTLVHIGFVAAVGVLSWRGPVQNLLSSRQLMNSSFDPFRLVNTYGAFGTVGKERNELILFGTYDEDPNSHDTTWVEFEFNCKPGSLTRRPCVISPFHYRIDWQIWFVGFPPHRIEHHSWAAHLVAKLLRWDNTTLASLDPVNYSRFPQGAPKWIKGDMYRYQYTEPTSPEAWRGMGSFFTKSESDSSIGEQADPNNSEGRSVWWTRTYKQHFIPPVNLESKQLLRFLDAHGWTA